MRRLIAYLFVLALSVSVGTSQVGSRPLSNNDVIQMVSLGLSDDVIIEKIRSVSATNFDTSVQGLKALKAGKVSDAVLKAMINLHGSPPKTTLGKAAEQGNGFAENNTGYMYLRGLGVAQDYKQALVWFTKAADEHNNPSAEQNLGWMYEHGLGVTQDYQQAVTWYRKAADQGHVGGQCALAWMYQHGLGRVAHSSRSLA
jgi:Sel1 repeat